MSFVHRLPAAEPCQLSAFDGPYALLILLLVFALLCSAKSQTGHPTSVKYGFFYEIGKKEGWSIGSGLSFLMEGIEITLPPDPQLIDFSVPPLMRSVPLKRPLWSNQSEEFLVGQVDPGGTFRTKPKRGIRAPRSRYRALPHGPGWASPYYWSLI